jgi:hypothetical protein
MAATAVPNMNPTGVIGSGSGNTMPGQTGTPFSGFVSPGTGGAGSMNFGNSANPNPTSPAANPYMAGPQATPAGTPGTSAPAGAPGTNTASNTFGQSGNQQADTLRELQTYYGSGMGSLIYNYLQSNGGYNSSLTQQAVDGQVNAMGQQVQLGANNLESMLGAQGVSGGSSGATQSLTNYENQATTQENAITSQEYYNMWNQSQSNELSVLEQTANVNAVGTANQFTWQDALGDVLGLGGAVGSIMTGIGLNSGGGGGGGLNSGDAAGILDL